LIAWEVKPHKLVPDFFATEQQPARDSRPLANFRLSSRKARRIWKRLNSHNGGARSKRRAVGRVQAVKSGKNPF